MSILTVLLLVILAPTFGFACYENGLSAHSRLGPDLVVCAEIPWDVLEMEQTQPLGIYLSRQDGKSPLPLKGQAAELVPGGGVNQPGQHTLGHVRCPACAEAKERAMQSAEFGALPLRAAAEVWIGSRSRIAPKTRWCYEKCYFPRLLEELGDLPLNQIHLGHILEYRKKRQSRAGASTINHEISALQQILKRANLWGPIASWYEPLPLPKTGPGKALEWQEERALFRMAASDPRWTVAYCCSLISANTTAGPGEIRLLQLKDVNLRDRVIYIREGAKNEFRVRTLPLNADALWAAEKLMDRARNMGATQPEHYLLPHRAFARGAEPDPTVPMGSWKKAWYSLTKKAGLKGLRRYDLRHHAITKLLENPDISEQTIESIAGHVSPKMKERYSHIRLQAKRDAVGSLSSPAKKVAQPVEILWKSSTILG